MSVNAPVYEIINPSDKYTISHHNREAVCMAVALLGEGAYAIAEIDVDPATRFEMPLFIFGGSDEWFSQQFGKTIVDALDSNIEDVIEALDSILIGDRELYNMAVSEMDKDAVPRFKDKWQDKHRTSMNDIGSYASALRDRLKKRLDSRRESVNGTTCKG